MTAVVLQLTIYKLLKLKVLPIIRTYSHKDFGTEMTVVKCSDGQTASLRCELGLIGMITILNVNYFDLLRNIFLWKCCKWSNHENILCFTIAEYKWLTPIRVHALLFALRRGIPQRVREKISKHNLVLHFKNRMDNKCKNIKM